MEKAREKGDQGGRENAPPQKKPRKSPPCGKGRDDGVTSVIKGREGEELPSLFAPPPGALPCEEGC